MSMKKAIVLALALSLALCACGKTQTPISAAPVEAAQTVEPVQMQRSYRSYAITADNWQQYFEVAEIPLYIVTSSEVISQVCQNYCVVLRDEYLPYLNPDGAYSVRFEVAFDIYAETLNIDTVHYTYQHTDDKLYAGHAEKSAVFDRAALPRSAFGTDYNARVGYSNAFFNGWAAVQPESKVWAGFYIDPASIQVTSASGTIELAL